MSLSEKTALVLGAGVAGLAAAWRLAEAFPGRVIVIEKRPYIGGLAATVDVLDRRFDLGSHRIHQTFQPDILRIIRELCRGDILTRRRHGRILIEDHLMNYPPNAVDVLQTLGARRLGTFAAGMLRARVRALLTPPRQESFETYARDKLGEEIYRSFYRPYAWKLWGQDPSLISHEPAMRRTRQGFWTEIRRLVKRRKETSYLYPADGIGAVAAGLAARATANGARIILGAEALRLELNPDGAATALAFRDNHGMETKLACDLVVATISPENLLALLPSRSAGPAPQETLKWRALRIVFFCTALSLPRECETYYIPQADYAIGRISEVAKYSPRLAPPGVSPALTLEIPCSAGDTLWNMPDLELFQLCAAELGRLRLSPPRATYPLAAASIKLDTVYPIHLRGWRERYQTLRRNFSSIPNLYRAGRTALFMHCNLDHSIMMGLKLGEWLRLPAGEKPPWSESEEGFAEYYVRE